MNVRDLIAHLQTLPPETPVLFEARGELVPRFVDQENPSSVSVKRLTYPTGGTYYRLWKDRDEEPEIAAITF